ncbi:GNAT family N-acetyltransferase [Bacillus sp. BP-3]|uniref:GNAT family N-acetyltransferase n=1 Tax=Bacillus sp. BP-3 TaxID=3022773 RepID=UPI00232C12B4|nr:GNAT family N-acetyltransferase [Bacillus sp. BP-3]MDC2864429.1 GNAT family N-acetyltransferase [Bacillus sp. BP-3]
MNNKNFKLSILDENDIEGLISLSELVGWDYDRNEIRTVMSSGKILGHKNEMGQIVSSAAIIAYDTNLASIGMVIVNPKYRGQGLGKKATKECINLAAEKTSIMLIATTEGKPLYKKMGFHEVGYVHKFICNNYTASDEYFSTRLKAEELRENDLNTVIELDKNAFGDSRREFLVNRIRQSHQSLVLKDEFGSILGYGLSILGPVNLILGPIVAPDYKAAAFLTHQLAFNHKGKLRIDIPTRDELFMTFLKDSGFEKVSQPPIMIINSDSMPIRNNHLYGIAAQIFG